MRVFTARNQDLNEQMAELDIEDEENEDFTFDDDVEEQVNKYEMCLVGRTTLTVEL